MAGRIAQEGEQPIAGLLAASETYLRFKARTGCLVIVNTSLNVRGGLDIGVGRAVLDP